MDTILPTAPQSYSRLIGYSLKLYAKSFRRVYPLAFVLSVIVFIPRLLVNLTGDDFLSRLPPLSPHRLWLILISIIGLMCFAAMLWRMHCVNHFFKEGYREDFKVALRKVISIFLAALLQSFILLAISLALFGLQIILYRNNILFQNMVLTAIVFIGQFLLILYVSTLFIFFAPLIAIENKGVIASLKRSAFLVWNYWWRVFSLQCFPWICFIITLAFIRFILGLDIHIYFIDHGAHPLWTSILQLLIFSIFIIWVAALLLVQLKDLELRKHIELSPKNAL